MLNKFIDVVATAIAVVLVAASVAFAPLVWGFGVVANNPTASTVVAILSGCLTAYIVGCKILTW